MGLCLVLVLVFGCDEWFVVVVNIVVVIMCYDVVLLCGFLLEWFCWVVDDILIWVCFV